MVQVPAASSDTEPPATEHTDGVSDENDTGRPDDADALTATGDCASVTFANAPNVIDCPDLVTTLGRRISTAVKFQRSAVGAVSFIVIDDPTAPVGALVDCTQKVSPLPLSIH